MHPKKRISLILIISAAIGSFSCNKGVQFQGSMMTKSETKKYQEATESFTTRQAHEIVDHNLENREKRERKAEKERKRVNDELKEVNKAPKHLEPQPYQFY